MEKENVAMELFRKVFGSDDEEIADIRAQHGVGADAVDKSKHFYELKVNAGIEPDVVAMTTAEVKRARITPGFFLVVISGIEDADVQPKVRIIVDPLSQLQPTTRGSITLSGVRNATSLTYDFVRREGTEQAGKEDEAGVSGE